MNLKRFFAKDMRTALAAIKEELGSDAIIMSSKKVEGGIEIVAALDYKVEDSETLKNAKENAKESNTNNLDSGARANEVNTKRASGLSGNAQSGYGLKRAPVNKNNSTSLRTKSNQESDDDLADDNVSISSELMSKNGRGTRVNDEMSAESLKKKQEKFADSLAALLARQEQTGGLGENSSRAMSNSTGGSGTSGSRSKVRGYGSNDVGSSNGASGLNNVINNGGERPRSLMDQNNNRGGFMRDGGFNGNRPKIIDKTDSNVETREQISSLSKEVEAIRRLLQFQLAGLMQDERSRDEPVRAMITRLLTAGGFAEDIAERLSQKVNADSSFNLAWQELARILENNIRGGNDTIMKSGGAVALVGPTGVGKTTTLAKIAARFALKYGSDQVALISTDHYRIGASEQLQTYGRIMGCTVKIVDDVSTLSEVLYQLRSKSLVLIDTAGFGQRDVRLMQELTDLERNAGVRLQHYLVLPATGQRRVLEDAYARFSNLGIDGLVLTKLDESMSLGDAASLCIAHDLELSYITTGQRVPEDIEVANPASFVQRVLAQIEELEPGVNRKSQAAGLEGADWARNLKVSE